MRRAAGFALWALPAASAFAHGSAHFSPGNLWRTWDLDPLVLAPLLGAAWLYGGGLLRLWKQAGRGRGVSGWQALAFLLGIAVLGAALVSPLDALGASLLSAHMAQHGLLVAAAPPLLLCGKPGIVFAWGLPPRWRKGMLGSAGWRALAGCGNRLARPSAAALLHGLALWLWHAPAAYEAALASYAMHALEHISLFGTALLFWRAMLEARSRRRAALALAAAFATMMHCGLLGALITMAPLPLYAWYAGRTEPWGMSALEDQQLAGLLMWVPMGVIYLACCLLLARRLVVSKESLPVVAAEVHPDNG